MPVNDSAQRMRELAELAEATNKSEMLGGVIPDFHGIKQRYDAWVACVLPDDVRLIADALRIAAAVIAPDVERLAQTCCATDALCCGDESGACKAHADDVRAICAALAGTPSAPDEGDGGTENAR